MEKLPQLCIIGLICKIMIHTIVSIHYDNFSDNLSSYSHHKHLFYLFSFLVYTGLK